MTRSTTPTSAVLVTGGASGIGRASAEAVAAEGRPVALWDLNAEGAAEVANRIAADLRPNWLASTWNGNERSPST